MTQEEMDDVVGVLAGQSKYPTKWNSVGTYSCRVNVGKKTLRWWFTCCGRRLRKVYSEQMLTGGETAPEGSRLRRIRRSFRGLTCLKCGYVRE